eukprot:GFUD01019729.1.p1 GENE.GFUD01019729.1~~GFUD01019729.1.p1  ORF type:complete len:572 (+),score=123.07 GFUD01019729.1:68-1783(+)
MKLVLLGLLVGVLGVWGRVDELDEFERMMNEPKDRSGWVDPLDMDMYDSKQNNCPELVDRLTRCEKDLVVCQRNTEKIAKSVVLHSNTTTVVPEVETKPVHVKSSTEIFLKRHVSHLISKLGLMSSTEAHLKVEIQLNSFQVQSLENFVSPQSSVHAVDVDQILSSFIKSVETYERSPWIEVIKEQVTSFKDPLLVILMAMSLVYLTFTMFRSLPPYKVFLMVLLVSVMWHWVHMYKATWASKHSKLVQSVQIPPECRPQDMTWFQTIQSSATTLFSSVDKCEEYHKAILVDPIYEVNPLTALVDLATKLVLHPLSSLGKEVGSMFSGLLGSVPFFWKVPVLLVFVVLLMFVMILFAGYKVRLPLFLGEIGPASVPASNLALEEQIRDLKSMIGHIKSGQSAVDGRTENCLQFDPKDSRLSRQSSGIEELVPLGYDCHEKNHPKEKSLPAICGTPKKSKTNLILTPVKARVMSQPDILHNPLNFPADEPNSENQILDLTRKRSDSFPKSPVKNLLAEGCESPRSTEFRWVSTEDKEEVDEQTIPKERLICEENRSEFLNKVEEVFKSTDEE